MKRFASVFLFLVIFCTVLVISLTDADAATIYSGKCGDNLMWTLDDTGNLTISGTGVMWNWRNGYGYAPWYSNRSSIKTVVIDSGVTSIGERAFYLCTKLTSVTIPDSVTSIGSSAFSSCTGLTKVYISNITAWCNIEFKDLSSNPINYAKELYLDNTPISGNLIIPEGTKRITDYAFYHCTSLTAVTIPDSVTSIGSSAFNGCTGLTSVTIPDSVTSIGEYAFVRCTGLTEIRFNAVNMNDLGSSYYVFDNAGQNSTGIKVTIGAQVTKIPANLFSSYTPYEAPKITTVEFEEGSVCTSIGSYAFYSCTSLTSVTVPDSVTSIGSCAFSGCTSLLCIGVEENNDNYCNDAYGVLYNKNKTILLQVPGGISGSYSIPSSVTSIGDYAFRECTGLTAVTIPNSVTNIAERAFYFCTRLTAVTIPDSVTSIGSSAFYNCTALSHVAYTGTQTQWNMISIQNANTSLTSATRHYTTSFQTVDNCVVNRIYCPVCEKYIISVYKESGAHSFKTVITAPTCTENGSTTTICTVCGEEKTEIILAAGHSGTWIVLSTATCTEDGINARICDICGQTETKVVPKGHNFNIIITEPTCTQQGYTTKICSGCGEMEITDYIPAKGHVWSAWVQTKAPSCISEGTQMRFCSCGTKEAEYIAKLPHIITDSKCTSCGSAISGYVVLSTDTVLTDLQLTEDLYVNLNGYNLTGTITTNGYKIYGMDSSTDGYTCENIGYFNCIDKNGKAITPATHFKSDITGATKRYMAIKDENGYSFHRFYLGITNVSLTPNVTGFGYKAEFYGDEMVQQQIASIGYNLWLTEGHVVNRTIEGFRNSLTLRLKNFDVVNYGETPVNASVSITLADGTVIESSVTSMSMRTMLENINAQYDKYSDVQLSAVKAMIEKHAIIKSWDTKNLFA